VAYFKNIDHTKKKLFGLRGMVFLELVRKKMVMEGRVMRYLSQLNGRIDMMR